MTSRSFVGAGNFLGGRVSLSRRHRSSTEKNRPAKPGWRSFGLRVGANYV